MIDFHTHPVLIREIVESHPEQMRATREVFHIGNNLQPIDTFLLQMDVAGIEKSVLLPIDCASRTGVSISTNEIVAALCEKTDRFIGFASVDPNDPKAPEHLEKGIKELNLKGLKLSPATQGFDPTDRNLAFPVYEKAEQLGIPVIFHAGMSWEPETKLMPGHPGRLEEAATEFPELNIVIAHFGWPWVLESVALSLKYKNIFIDTSCLYFDSPAEFLRFVMSHQIPITVVERSLRWKLLFGSNYPRVEIKNMVKAVRSLGLTDGCLDLIFQKNAEKLLAQKTPVKL
ncbi:MAG: amidohydrolase family protein [bacterium]